MKFCIILLCGYLSISNADVLHAIAKNKNGVKNTGAYSYQYQTPEGISAHEHGVGGVSVQGASSYISPEGIEIKTSYTADETGYHPVGDHIPKIPDYILRALEYIRTHPQKEENNYERTNVHKSAFTRSAPITTHFVPPPQTRAYRKVTPTTSYRSNTFNRQNQKGRRY